MNRFIHKNFFPFDFQFQLSGAINRITKKIEQLYDDQNENVFSFYY